MITRAADGGSASVIPEEPDDIVTLRRVIAPGDSVTASATRSLRRQREGARPDRGERVRVRIRLDARRVLLDGGLDRLVVRGTIAESDSEAVPRGAHHTLRIRIGDGVTVSRPGGWGPVEPELLRRSAGRGGFVLAAADSSECGIARVSGTHMHIMPNIYSGASGKRYRGAPADMDGFYSRSAAAAAAAAERGDRIIVFGPGQAKNRIANRVREGGGAAELADGIDAGGEEGLRVFSRSAAMSSAMAGCKLDRALRVVDEAVLRASRRLPRFAMGVAEVRRACAAGAVESLVFSGGALGGPGEDAAVALLNEAEARGAEALAVDSSTDIGLRVAGLGGMVALLRFAVP